ANQRSKTQQRSTAQQRNTAQQRRKESGAPIIRDSRMSGSGKNRSGSKPASAEKKHIHISKRAAMIVLCVIALFALVGFTGYKFIRVETLTVTGCKTYDPNYVISISGIKTGDHIFSLNKKEIAANIDSDPHLIFNDMQYTFPSTVTLIVTERVGACIFVSDNQYIITDSDGYIVEIDSTKPSSSLPIVTGLTLSKADLGEKYETTDSFRKLILEDLLKQIDAQSLSDIITGIDLTDTNSIKLSTTYGITVNLGQSDDFSSKLSKLQLCWKTLTIREKLQVLWTYPQAKRSIAIPLPLRSHPLLHTAVRLPAAVQSLLPRLLLLRSPKHRPLRNQAPPSRRRALPLLLPILISAVLLLSLTALHPKRRLTLQISS
ncbi:MAG: cell division protein FtsQ/DivIB, partial [Christensenellaceae bacterium]